jgi:hypothetical protein
MHEFGERQFDENVQLRPFPLDREPIQIERQRF